MIKKYLNKIVFRLFFLSRSKAKLRKKIELTFKFKEFFEIYINRLVFLYYDGKHPKHHLWKDHYKFLIDNINPRDKVLDVGCGGSLSYNQDLALKIDFLDAIDINEALIGRCSRENQFKNIHFSVLDITKELPIKKYDVVILSHVLEHLERPDVLLKKIKQITKKIIVRLPRYDDHWMNLVKKDLGMFYFKDRDHKREYTLDTAINMIKSTGWNIEIALNDIDIKIIASINNKNL